MWLNQTSAPSAQAVNLDEAKRHLRITGTADDTDVTEKLNEAIAFIDGRQGVLGRALITQQWEYRIHAFPACGIIRLPLPPLQSVESVQYLDTSGVLQTLDAGLYGVDTETFIGQIRRSYSKTWPSVRDEAYAVRIAFTAGYGNAGSDIPGPIKSAIKLVLTQFYERRAGIDMDALQSAVRTVAGPYVFEVA